jgi:hypothetical protein
MIEPQFEMLSRQIGMVMDAIAGDLNDRAVVVAALSPTPPRDGSRLTIRKSSSPLDTEHGTFSLKNDDAVEMVRIELGDTRLKEGQFYEVDVVPASTVTPDMIRARIVKFVDDWLARV